MVGNWVGDVLGGLLGAIVPGGAGVTVSNEVGTIITRPGTMPTTDYIRERLRKTTKLGKYLYAKSE